MRKFLMFIAVLAVSSGAVADAPVHKVTPEYNSGFCFGGMLSISSTTPKDQFGDLLYRKGYPVCSVITSAGLEFRLQSDLERQLSAEQVKEIKKLIMTFKNDCTSFGEKYYWKIHGCYD